jgi:cytochrome c
MESRTFVSARWSRGGDEEEIVEPGLALMRASDCFNCHSTAQKIVGPALLDVANKYRGQSGALEASVLRVLKGSSGVWSPVPMLAHERLTADQVQMMVRWVYSLEPGKTGPELIRGVTGQIVAPGELLNHAGVLEAVYTDAGRAPAGPLTGKATVSLRNHRVEAEEGVDLTGVAARGADEASGQRVLRVTGAIGTARYAALNLAGIASVTCRVAAPTAGGTLELRRDSAGGELLARFEIKPTGAWNKWSEISAPLKPLDARADVVAVFSSPGQSNWMSLDWIQFDTP